MTGTSVDRSAASLQPSLPMEERASAGGALLLLLPAIGLYAVLLTMAGTTGLFEPVTYGLNFNSMLLHLLRGRFDVDPAAIGYEGYLRDGAVYSYFGVFPALLRTPFLLMPDFAATDFTRVSCLAAVSLMALFKVLSAMLVWRNAAANWRPVMLSLLVATILLSGPQIQFLRPSIYQEVLLWQGVFAAAFVWLVLQGWTRPAGFTTGLMSALALDAGLCLLTGVSTALGLYLGVGLIWLWRAWHETQRGGDGRRMRHLWVAPLVLVAFVAVTAFINLERWGNPLVFVDLRRGLIGMAGAPDVSHADPLGDYGAFNPVRLPFGLIYYFLPLWVLHADAGHLWWQGFVERTMSDVELPPSSFLASDPLLIGLAVYGTVRLLRGVMPASGTNDSRSLAASPPPYPPPSRGKVSSRTPSPVMGEARGGGDIDIAALSRRSGLPALYGARAPLALAALGLGVPALLMLMALAMTFRYRMEFYPFFELLAFIGFAGLLATAPRRAPLALFAAGSFVSIAAAMLLWLVYMLSPFGIAAGHLGPNSAFTFYGCMLEGCMANGQR